MFEKSVHQDQQTSFRHEFLIAVAIILVSIIILIGINLAISYLVNNQLDPSILNKVIFPSSAFAPEHVERTQYLVSLIAFPVLCFAGWLLSSKLKAGKDRLTALLYPAIAFATTIGIGLLLYFALERTVFLYIKGFTFLTLIFYLMFLFGIYIEWRYPSKCLSALLRFITIFVGTFLILTIFFMCLNTDSDTYKYTEDFEAYFYPVVQVFGGKTLLIDLNNHYGFYPYFLQPIFKLIGLDVIQLTTVIGVLLAGVFIILFFLNDRVIRSRFIAICAMLSISGTWLWWLSTIMFVPYFQYWPHRLLFPGLLLLIIWFYQKASGPSKYLQYYSAFGTSGIALLWNIETGIVVFGTWVLFLYWESLGQWRFLPISKVCLALAKHTLLAFSALALTIGSLYLYTFLRSGVFPDLSEALRYQAIYYGAGFAMLPMPLIHPWNLVVLTYMVGICISFNSLVKKLNGNVKVEDQAQSHRVNMIFVLSLMGAGLFSWYQGRSHDYSLDAMFWSAFFLIAIYADIILSYIRTDLNSMAPMRNKASKAASGSLFLLLTFVLVCYSGGIVELFPKFAYRILAQLQAVNQLSTAIDHATGHSSSNSYVQNINFIRKYFSPGDEVLILSMGKQTIYYMKSATTNPVDVPSFLALFYKSEQQKVFDYLLNARPVDKDKRYVPIRVIVLDDYKSSEYFQLINEHYTIIDRINDMTLYEKRID